MGKSGIKRVQKDTEIPTFPSTWLEIQLVKLEWLRNRELRRELRV
jgi:hypothetical protein